MSFISDFFVDVKQLPSGGYGFIQLIYLLSTYAYCLMLASNMISSGSELLLLVPSYAGIVGSIVLPILGTLPDSCIILFSGLGPDSQNQLNVGVGALAGSTVMLLTIPWCISIFAGRVNYDPATGMLSYWGGPKLSPPNNLSLRRTGVNIGTGIQRGAWILMGTATTYLLLQGPGLVYESYSQEKLAKTESAWAFVGMIVCAVLFCSYLVYQLYTSSSHLEGSQNDRRNKAITDSIHRGEISLLGVMKSELGDIIAHHASEGTPLIINEEAELLHRLKVVLWPFFHKYDESKTGTLDIVELAAAMRDLGENVGHDELVELFDEFDQDNSGFVDFHEFVIGTGTYIKNNSTLLEGTKGVTRRCSITNRTKRLSSLLIDQGKLPSRRASSQTGVTYFESSHSFGVAHDNTDFLEEQEQEEEVPVDLHHLSPDEQQNRIKRRAFLNLLGGTLMLLLFSDPMVDALDEVGSRTGIGSFYISFVFAPLVANAPELVAAYHHSSKKTTSSIAISLSTLQGSVCMNNTFALGMFMIIIYTQKLAWRYLAETLTILIVEVVAGLMSLKRTHTVLDGLILLSLYPLSVLLVMTLEYCGWD